MAWSILSFSRWPWQGSSRSAPGFRPPRTAAEHRGVCQQDVAGPGAAWGHPEEEIELLISCRGERMGPGKIDRLPRQNVNGLRVLCRQRIVGQVRMEVERGDSIQQARFVEILELTVSGV